MKQKTLLLGAVGALLVLFLFGIADPPKRIFFEGLFPDTIRVDSAIDLETFGAFVEANRGVSCRVDRRVLTCTFEEGR